MTDQEPQQVILTLTEAAGYAGCSEKKLRRLIKGGQIPAARQEIAGRAAGAFKYLLHRQELDRGIAEGLFPGHQVGRQGTGQATRQNPAQPGQGYPADTGQAGQVQVDRVDELWETRQRLAAAEAERNALRAELSAYREREQRLLGLLDRSLPAHLDRDTRQGGQPAGIVEVTPRPPTEPGPGAMVTPDLAPMTPVAAAAEPETRRPGFWRRLFYGG